MLLPEDNNVPQEQEQTNQQDQSRDEEIRIDTVEQFNIISERLDFLTKEIVNLKTPKEEVKEVKDKKDIII